MNSGSIGVILYPGCIFFEISLAIELLAKKFKIVAITPDGEPHQASNGITINETISFGEAANLRFQGILVPGGNPKCLVENIEIDNLLVQVKDKNTLIAAICAGPSVLAKAGILKGHRIAHGYNSEQLHFLRTIFQDVVLTDDLIVADRNILTAKAEAHIDFAVEVACRLECVDAKQSGRLKEYYRGTLGRKIRPLALAILKNKDGKTLLHCATDKIKNEVFYRPLGGGIEFAETGSTAIVREIKEELNLDVTVDSFSATLENIFEYEGMRGHEIVLLYNTRFLDTEVYNFEELDIYESGQKINKAVWRTVSEIQTEGAKLYPLGIEKYI